MASSHEGSPKIAEFIIKSAAKAKADGILFQLMNLDTYIVPDDEDYQDTKSFYLNQKGWAKLIRIANNLGLDIWANVYDLESAEFCQGKPIKGFKFHSSNLENKDLIRKVVKLKKPLLLSIGGMQKEEIKKVLDFICSIDEKAKIHLMYGLQNFPTDPKGVNLNFIKDLSQKFSLPWGYQDHSEPTSSASTYLPVLAAALGASIIEKHITYNRELKGQDYEAALNPDEFAEFVKDLKIIDNILSKKPDDVSSDELKYRKYKSLIKVIAKKDIKAGEKFTRDNLVVMRKKLGEISGWELETLLNKKSKHSYEKFDSLKKDELS